MNYNFKCESCEAGIEISAPMSEGPPESVACCCGGTANRNWQADLPNIDTSGCRDHDFIPEQHRVASNDGFGVGKRGAERKVQQFKQHNERRRKQLADGGNKGSVRHTHSVPADLYHGKIKETGDKSYWQDPANMAKHNSCRVDK